MHMRILLAVSVALLFCSSCRAQTVELRGAWLWAEDCKDKPSADVMLDRAETLNLNSLYFLVFYRRGQAAWRSSMAPMLEDAAEGFDPLGYLVEQGRRRGMEIHAWFVNGSYGWGSHEGILDERPEWRAMDLRGARTDWYDLCQPAVREWQTRLMCEVLERYDVAGVHFDYVRFSDKSVCTCPECRKNAMAEVGLDIASLTFPALPAYGWLSGNPIVEPTTARVLAEFDDGVPAIALNSVGKGSVLLLNWQVQRWCPGAVISALRAALAGMGVQADGRVLLLDSDVNATRYERDFWEVKSWIESLGYRVERTTDEGIAKLPPGSTVVLHGFYMMTDEIASALLRHVQAGGGAVFIDGPVFAMKYPSAQALLGFKRMGKYLNGERAMVSTGVAPQIVPSTGRRLSIPEEKAKLALWDRWRRDQVTGLVASVHRRAKEIRPDALVTAAVFYNEQGTDNVLQDWPGWLREGLCDYVIPMSYVKTPEELDSAFAWWKRIDPGLERIIPAVGAWQLEPDSPGQVRAQAIGRQVEVCRRQGAHGAVMFVLKRIDDETATILGRTAFPGKAVPYRPPAR